MRGLNRSIVALLALLLILCIAVPEMADAAMLRQGSSGEQVKMLQSKLKRWGIITAMWTAYSAAERRRP